VNDHWRWSVNDHWRGLMNNHWALWLWISLLSADFTANYCTNGRSSTGVFLIWRGDYNFSKRLHRTSEDMKTY
jgi:hypothetical protein